MGAPTVRRRRLGAELRQLREGEALTQEEAAAKAGLTAAKLSRLETAQFAIKPDVLKSLLTLYRATDEKRAVLLALAREGARRGWWQPYRDMIDPAYSDLISLEAEAVAMRTFEALLIPGLLQTAAYARAVIGGGAVPLPADQINARVEVRIGRQSVLTRPNPLEIWAIVHEAALRTRIKGSKSVMRDQLQRLIDLSELPHVYVQVLSSEAAPHPGYSGGFSMLRFPEGEELDVVVLENLSNTLYIEEREDVAVYTGAFERLRAEALSFDDSRAMIERLKDNE
ncbi:helix-turn-helix domain-containing protein [Streptomyces sp. RPT161]|uniref:helix-turn-helix domain-containing protein n=1 Tax=Streptomyces sp. RPT161 TaxID=3015993 RepID=UPI0022B87FA2|nr:helix-turn-helix transcriptional regulator [Streptomyces sp. RPT161]